MADGQGADGDVPADGAEADIAGGVGSNIGVNGQAVTRCGSINRTVTEQDTAGGAVVARLGVEGDIAVENRRGGVAEVDVAVIGGDVGDRRLLRIDIDAVELGGAAECSAEGDAAVRSTDGQGLAAVDLGRGDIALGRGNGAGAAGDVDLASDIEIAQGTDVGIEVNRICGILGHNAEGAGGVVDNTIYNDVRASFGTSGQCHGRPADIAADREVLAAGIIGIRPQHDVAAAADVVGRDNGRPGTDTEIGDIADRIDTGDTYAGVDIGGDREAVAVAGEVVDADIAVVGVQRDGAVQDDAVAVDVDVGSSTIDGNIAVEVGGGGGTGAAGADRESAKRRGLADGRDGDGAGIGGQRQGLGSGCIDSAGEADSPVIPAAGTLGLDRNIGGERSDV